MQANGGMAIFHLEDGIFGMAKRLWSQSGHISKANNPICPQWTDFIQDSLQRCFVCVDIRD